MNRRYDYDVLRVASMFGVIYLHAASGALRTLNLPALWYFSNFLTALATPAVPLFFMMSGALLLGEEATASLRRLFRRRIPKVLVPLCVWSAAVLLYQAAVGNGAEAKTALFHILNTPAAVPYWFLYALIPMYLLSPALKRMADGLTRTHWNYLMLLWIVCTLGLGTVRAFVPDAWTLTFTEHWSLNINAVGGYLGYFLLGAYLERLERVPSRKALALAAAALFAVIAAGTWWDTFAHMEYSDRFTNYLHLFTFLFSSALFLLAKSCLRGREEKGRLLPLLSGASFCVYLAHPLALLAGERLWARATGAPGPASIPQQLLFYGCAALSCVAAAVLLASVKPLCFPFTGQRFACACSQSNLFALFRRKRP